MPKNAREAVQKAAEEIAKSLPPLTPEQRDALALALKETAA